MQLYIYDGDLDYWGGNVFITVADSPEEALRNIEQDIISAYGHIPAREEEMAKLRKMTPKVCRSKDYYIGE